MLPITSKPGLVLFNKPAGVTSFEALYPLKRRFGRTLGHTGTLDSFAEGLLVVLVGRLTKLNAVLTDLDKIYEATFEFGRETDTLDPSGATVLEGPVPELGVAELATHWLGRQAQRPPEYSAVHVNGARASDRVRRGETVIVPPREIEVYALDVFEWKAPQLRVRIHCSKGTYVRSIARDWGRAVGCGAHVSALKRLQVGPFILPEGSAPVWLPPEDVWQALHIPRFIVNETTRGLVENGRDLEELVPELRELPGECAVLESEDGELIALVERHARWKYRFVERRRAD